MKISKLSVLMLTLALALLTGTVGAQDVPVEKYELPNGMTVILHEDHTVPSATINLWYYVASKDEAPGRSGFAHLFEHLMFMGTERVPGSGFDDIMEAGGGFNNATTSEDRTNYFSFGPAELLPKLLWLDADRLEDLGKAMTQEKLDKQRAVVRNERRQSYENRPYGRAALKVHEMMFPEGHPYHRSVIGSHADLEAATVEDVKNFFSTYYVPSNASLVVAGDFDPQEIKPIVAKLFGTLPRGSDVVHPEAAPVKLDKVKRLTMTDNVQFARTTFAYHSPPRFAPGDAEMDLAGAILTDGISSRLYQRLVYQDKLAVDVSAYQESMLLGSVFEIQATAAQGVNLDDLEAAMDEVLAEFVEKGPTAEELEKQKAELEYAAVSQLESLFRKADRLNAYEFFYGEPNSFKRDLDRYRNATRESVRDGARRVLTPDARLVLRVIPEIEAPEPSPRGDEPEVADAEKFTPPLPETFTLDNGITVHHWQRTALPLVAMKMLLPAGAAQDPARQAGLGSLVLNMLDEGAADRGAVEFADALSLLGARFDARVGHSGSSVQLSALKRNFDRSLDLFADAVRRPRFDEKEWLRVHDLHLQELIQAEDQPTSVARVVSMRAFFGDEHPYGRATSGSRRSVEPLTLADVERHYANIIRPEKAVILTAGDLSAKQIEQSLARALGDWKVARGAGSLAAPKFPEAPGKGFRLVIVDRPGAVQTVVRFMMPGALYGDARRKKLELIGTILGGSFTSRLNRNLREEHGYTYGASCGYAMDPKAGYFTANSRVRTDVTGASIGEFLKEFNGIRTGNISTEEARKARSSQRIGMIQSFARLGGILDTATPFIRDGRPLSTMAEELSDVDRITESDLNGLARGAVPLETGVLVLVGDKKEILGQLEGLDLPEPEELTVLGDPVDSGASSRAAR